MHQKQGQHPFAFSERGWFETAEEELRASYGLQSAADLDAVARKAEARAAACEPLLKRLRENNVSAEHIAFHERMQSEAASSAAEYRRWADQARAFEARWGFDPYTAAPPPTEAQLRVHERIRKAWSKEKKPRRGRRTE